MFVKVRVRGEDIAMLVDTGASVTLLSEKFIESLPGTMTPIMKPVNTTLITATGESTPFLGQSKVSLSIGTETFEHDVLIANIQNDGILGLDFLEKNNCTVKLSDGILYIGSESKEIRCYKSAIDVLASCCECKIAVLEDIEIPPRCEMIVPGAIVHVDGYPQGQYGIIEPAVKFVERKGLLVAKSVVDISKEIIPLRMINLLDTPSKVYKGSIAAICEEVNSDDFVTYHHVQSLSQDNNISKERQLTDNPIPEHLKELIERSSTHLSSHEQEQMAKLLCSYQQLFSKNSSDLGRTTLVKHEIDTGNTRPIKQRSRRIPIAKMKEAEEEITRMKEEGIIEASISPWSSNIVLVKKKDGSLRFCVDFRQLNDITIKDSHPLPRIDDTLDALSGSKYFSTLDLKSGYWQVGLAENDKQKTAFSFPGGGLWQFTVMAFGLCNAPATFERLMERVLHGLSYDICLVYLDDIIVHSKTFDEQIENLKLVFERLKDANLKLSPNKCELCQTEVLFLGHKISENGISTDPNKIKAVKDWPTPKSTKEVRSFLGLTSYYRKFILHYADKARPLHKLTEKSVRFQWNDECQESFEILKDALITAPILSYPTEDGTFILDTDASLVSLGAVLSQVQDGTEKVISYYSKTFTRPERSYCVTRRELLAIVNSLKYFHHYLYGRHIIVRTDHGALRWLLNFKSPEGQMARWFEVLASYDFEVQHRAGRSHNNADALSRRPCVEQECSHCNRIENKESIDRPAEEQQMSRKIICATTRSKQRGSTPEIISSDILPLKEQQRNDPILKFIIEAKEKSHKPNWEDIAASNNCLKYYWQRWESLELRDNILYYRFENTRGSISWLAVIPASAKETILKQLHDGITGGHLGIKKTLLKIQQRYFWHQMRKDVESWCRNCHFCGSKKPPPKKWRAHLQQYNVGAPLERIGMDILGPFPRTSRGNKYLLVIGDYFTKWLDAIPVKDQEAITIAKAFVDRIVSIFGIPLQLHTDQGSNFESTVFKQICNLLGIQKTRTTPLHPQSDGMVERGNRTINHMLSAFVSENQKDWDEHIYLLMLAYRSSVHETTKVTPNEMMFGRQVTLPIELVFGSPTTNIDLPDCSEEYAFQLQNRIEKIHQFARENLQLSSDNMKRRYDKQSNILQLEHGDLVWLFNPKRSKGLCPKLQSKWEGPYSIIQKLNDVIFKIQKNKNSKPKIVHHDRLKPYTCTNNTQ